MEAVPGPQKRYKFEFVVWALCIGLTLFSAIVPFGRAFYRGEIDYNEGWNIYNAATFAAHHALYPVRYGWTTNNYPMLSFVMMAGLHRWTHEYLFTARTVSLLSLLSSAVLVGAIVFSLSGRRGAKIERSAALLAALFTVAIFCANADVYVGMNDPQMLAQVLFLAGLYVYIATRRSVAGITAAAVLFVMGGFIKHNPVDFPLAVLLDLLLVSRWKAVWFSVCGMALVAAGLALNVHFGGPHFIDALLAPRSWSLGKAMHQLRDVLGPILFPVGVAVFMAWRLRMDPARRVLAILLAASLLTGAYFGGGQGVSRNALFSMMLAACLLIGVFLSETRVGASRNAAVKPIAAISLFVWLLIPLMISGNWNFMRVLRETKAGEARFDREVAVLADEPGAALCESLLRCYTAGKPYVYDPFNATRLIELGKLDQTAFVQAIRERKFGAIQLDVDPADAAAVREIDPALNDRFTPQMLSAIRASYKAKWKNEDGVIFVPAAP